MKITVITAIALVILKGIAYGTAQEPDYIIYETRFFPLFNNPLESYPWPDGDRPQLSESESGSSTGNHRGYIAVWEIESSRLYLKAIVAFVDDGWEEVHGEEVADGEMLPAFTLIQKRRPIGLKELFRDKFIDGRVFAEWFSGTLRIPMGEQLEYVHMGYQSKYERDMFIEVQEGEVNGISVVDNTQSISEKPGKDVKTRKLVRE